MRSYTEEEAAEVVNFNYRRNVQTELPPGGHVKWTAGGAQLWLTAKDGRTVYLKGASVNVTDDALIITIPNDEAARTADVHSGQPE